MHILRTLKVSGDMGHELFNNIREGDWLLDYTNNRLTLMHDELADAIRFMREYFGSVKCLNIGLKPKYASRVFEKLYNSAFYEILRRRMKDPFVTENDDLFLQKLAIACIQMWGRVPSNFFAHFKDSMAAGLPHFTTGYMRCWGRDTFISLRGLLISPGLEDEARETIHYFARTMRHGLIPNLHDRCNNTRFNARDATWFFI
jgi:glycogen debranching enzyme